MTDSTSPSSPGPARVQVRTLGRFEIHIDGEPLRFDARGQNRPLQLLKTLIACGGTNVPQERLCDALWPDADGDAAVDRFNTTLRRLRGLVGAETLTLRNRALSLESDQCWVDALAFDALAARTAPDSLEAGLALYQGPFCDGEYEPGEIPGTRARLHESFLRLVREVAQRQAQNGDLGRAIETYRKGLETDEVAEDLVQGLMEGCLQAGRIAEGIAAFRRFEDTLRATLQVEPAPATLALFETLRHAQPDPASPPAPAAPPAADRPSPAPAPASRSPWRSRRFVRFALAAAAALVMAAAWIGWSWVETERASAALERFRAESELPLPDVPSLVVLPLRAAGGGAELEALADAISQTITTDLVGIQGLFVIASESARKYKEDAPDVREVGRRLGVRHVLHGTVQEEDDRIRVSAQLTDAVTGRHLWAERFDQSVEAPFAIFDAISRRVVVEMEVTLTQGEQARFAHSTTTSLAAYKLFARAEALRLRLRPAENLEARALLQQALALDPDFSAALLELGWTYWQEARYGWGPSRSEALAEAERIAQRITTLGERGFRPTLLVGLIHLLRREFDAAWNAVRVTVDRYPNHPSVHAVAAVLLISTGRPQEAVPYIQRAMRLSPHYPNWYLATLGDAYRLSGRHAEALQAFHELLSREPDDILSARPRLVALLVELGRMEEARGVAARLRELNPRFTVTRYGASRLYRDRAVTERMLAQLRQAGLPD